MKTKKLGHPTNYCPKGKFPQPLKSAPAAAVHLLAVAGRIKDLTDEHGVREVARQADLSNSTLSRTVTGEIWPSAIAIASLEQAYQIQIWMS